MVKKINSILFLFFSSTARGTDFIGFRDFKAILIRFHARPTRRRPIKSDCESHFDDAFRDFVKHLHYFGFLTEVFSFFDFLVWLFIDLNQRVNYNSYQCTPENGERESARFQIEAGIMLTPSGGLLFFPQFRHGLQTIFNSKRTNWKLIRRKTK